MRITECGQTKAHLLHWIQIDGSQTGISSAIFRFSHLAVPDGYVPSTGSALTGNESPSPAIIGPITLRTKSGASCGTGGWRVILLVTSSGTVTSYRFASVWSTAW